MVALSELERTLRLDAEYFQAEFRAAELQVRKTRAQSIVEVASVSDGNHFTISDSYTDVGVPYFRGQDVSGTFFADPNKATSISREAYDRPYMRRSHLRRGDVLLSIVGTIGSTALVDSDELATCSCKLAILRPNSISAEYLATYLASSYGQLRIGQLTRGAVQRGLILEDADQILIPRMSAVEEAVNHLIGAARRAQDGSQLASKDAEDTLLASLGLGGWSPPEPLTYTRSASEILIAGRLDSEFAAPQVHALLHRLGVDGATLRDYARVRHEKFKPAGSGEFSYIEIGDLDGFGRAAGSTVSMVEAPSRATWHVRAGDVITSTVRPIRRLSAIVSPEQDNNVCSSGFVVLQPVGMSSESLVTYLRLPLICRLMDLFATASMYPALSESDLMALPVPKIADEADRGVTEAVRRSRHMLGLSEHLLDAAKRAVEIAIERDEVAALAYVAEQQEAVNAAAL